MRWTDLESVIQSEGSVFWSQCFPGFPQRVDGSQNSLLLGPNLDDFGKLRPQILSPSRRAGWCRPCPHCREQGKKLHSNHRSLFRNPAALPQDKLKSPEALVPWPTRSKSLMKSLLVNFEHKVRLQVFVLALQPHDHARIKLELQFYFPPKWLPALFNRPSHRENKPLRFPVVETS